MPNHVHVLFEVGPIPMSEILKSWKGFTGTEANKWLGRRGNFWEEDYWDTFMRDPEHEAKTRRYIENNPAKAGLVLDPKDWLWSNARFRDEYAALRFPPRSANPPRFP